MKKIKLLTAGIALLSSFGCETDTSIVAPDRLQTSLAYEAAATTSQTVCANASNTTGAFNVGVHRDWRRLESFPQAGWIGPQASSEAARVPVGQYTYVTAFSVTNGVSLSGQILADNGATVYLNDVPIATLGAIDTSTIPDFATFQIPTSFSASSGFLNGSNSLKVVAYNAAPVGPSGVSYCFTVTGAANTDPVANAGGPYLGTEGSSVSLDLSALDPNLADVLSYEWNLGDGTTGAGSELPASHTYIDNGVYTITLTVNDGEGGTDTETVTASIDNVAPVLGAVTSSSSLVPVGTGVSISAPVSDIGTADTHSAAIDWNDGYTSVVNSSEGAVEGTHVYSAAGVYQIKVTAIDDDGGTSNTASYDYVVAYDPSAGFVTGGGWIVSPAGAYEPDSELSGRASFGFVAKYQKGASAPVGNTEFQFQAAGMNFKSTSYQWLVIAGAKAQYKGAGTLNGMSGYNFLLFATDGQVPGGGGIDRFRIKIKSPSGDVVYDNQRGAAETDGAMTALGGGSIIIHAK